MKWGRRFRRRLRRAFRRGKAPTPELPLSFHIEQGAEWSRNVNFTRNQSVLRIFVVVGNEYLASKPRAEVEAYVSGAASMLAQNAVRDLDA